MNSAMSEGEVARRGMARGWGRLRAVAAYGLMLCCLGLGQANLALATSSVYTDRDTFLAQVGAGYYDENFAGVQTGEVDAPLTFSNSGYTYSVYTQAGAQGGLYNAPGKVSTINAADQIVITFTTPVTAVGGNFWSGDADFNSTGTPIVITLSDGTVETVSVPDPSTFRGFVSTVPITSVAVSSTETATAYPTMSDLIVDGASPTTGLAFIYSFPAGSDGSYPAGMTPQGALVQGSDGNFYGTTPQGGAGGNGTVFKVTASGDLTVLHDFAQDGSEGAQSYTALIQGSDGNFYGTTTAGGNADNGTVFKITPEGDYTVLHLFQGGSEGSSPYGKLAQGPDGNFYGDRKSVV